jgi:hypothetical protein
MSVQDILHMLQEHPELCSLSLQQITTLVRLAARLRRDILLPQPLTQTDDSDPPDCLPESVAIFLSKAVGVPLDCMDLVWELLKDEIWDWPPARGAFVSEEDEDLFRLYGWSLGLSKYTHKIHSCTNKAFQLR